MTSRVYARGALAGVSNSLRIGSTMLTYKWAATLPCVQFSAAVNVLATPGLGSAAKDA